MADHHGPSNVLRWTPSPTRSPALHDHHAIDIIPQTNKSGLMPSFPFTAHPVISPSASINEDNSSYNNTEMSSALPPSFAEGACFLTWKDLLVTVPDRESGREKAILHELTGYAAPVEVLVAIMGPSGCGKSTLLDALAGRLGSDTRQAGDILIYGRRQVLSFGTSAYVTEDDTLMTTLTVQEAVLYSAHLQLPSTMPNSEKKERAITTIREMGLQDSMNTRIGGWNVKGLSGGQKRRVSIIFASRS